MQGDDPRDTPLKGLCSMLHACTLKERSSVNVTIRCCGKAEQNLRYWHVCLPTYLSSVTTRWDLQGVPLSVYQH